MSVSDANREVTTPAASPDISYLTSPVRRKSIRLLVMIGVLIVVTFIWMAIQLLHQMHQPVGFIHS